MLTLRQKHVKSAYFAPKVEEEYYMEHPKRFEKPYKNGQQFVCGLNKFYGLKQAANNPCAQPASFLISQDFERSKKDYCLICEVGNTKIYVLTWVDELVIAGSQELEIETLKL